jgi:hypothetical protein
LVHKHALLALPFQVLLVYTVASELVDEVYDWCTRFGSHQTLTLDSPKIEIRVVIVVILLHLIERYLLIALIVLDLELQLQFLAPCALVGLLALVCGFVHIYDKRGIVPRKIWLSIADFISPSDRTNVCVSSK